MYVVKIAVVLAVALFFIWLFINLKPAVDLRTAERISSQLADSLGSSELTFAKGVFLSSKLDAAEDIASEADKKNKNYELPYVRYCAFAYRLKIEDIDKKKEWEFGYIPDTALLISRRSIEMPVSILEEDVIGHVCTDDAQCPSRQKCIKSACMKPAFYENVRPAKMVLEVYDTWLTRAGCLAEQAYETKTIREMAVPCIRPLNIDKDFAQQYQCGLPIRKSGGIIPSSHVCIFYKPTISTVTEEQKDINCRYLPGVPIIESYVTYTQEKDTHIIRAYPLKQGFDSSLITMPNKEACTKLKGDLKDNIASESDNVGAVILCAE